MDRNQKSDEHLGQPTSNNSRHVMWKLSETSQATKSADCKDPSITRRRATGNWQLLLHRMGEKKNSLANSEPSIQTEEPCLALRYKPSHESQKYMLSKDVESDRLPIATCRSMSSKLISVLKQESFSLPPQQLCVVREEAPKFAQALRVDISDSWCSGSSSEVPRNSYVIDLDTNFLQQQSLQSELRSVPISAPTSSSFSEAARRDTSPIKSRATTGKVATGACKKGASSTTRPTEGKKCPSTSSGSTGSHWPNFRERQQELHRYRIFVEQRRLVLLDLRIVREREEAQQNTILFHKNMQIKEAKIKAFKDNNCSTV